MAQLTVPENRKMTFPKTSWTANQKFVPPMSAIPINMIWSSTAVSYIARKFDDFLSRVVQPHALIAKF